MIKVRYSPAVMAVSHGRISEHESENIFCNSKFVPTNPANHSDEAHCVGNCTALAADCELANGCVGCPALACSFFYALGLDERREGNLSYLLFPVSSITRKIVFSFWKANDIFVG